MKIVIGIVGPPSCGKGTVTDVLIRRAQEICVSASSCRSRDILKETLDIWDMAADRAHFQKLAEIMAAPTAFGSDVLSRAVKARFMKSTSDIVIADGMRWPSDEKMLRSLPSSVILYVTADPKIRYERLKLRRGVGEKDKTWEEFLEEERAATELFIADFGSRADYKIVNNATEAELEIKVRDFFNKLVAPVVKKV